MNGNVTPSEGNAPELPKQETKEQQPDQVSPEKIDGDVRGLIDNKVQRAESDVSKAHETVRNTETMMVNLRVETLSPQQRQLIGEGVKDPEISTEQLKSWVSLVSKFSPDLCDRLAKEQPLQQNDFKVLAALYPQLSPDEQRFFEAMPILPMDAINASVAEIVQNSKNPQEATLALLREYTSHPDRADENRATLKPEKTDRGRERVYTKEPTGYMTNNATALLDRWGITSHGGVGTGWLESRLGVEGSDHVNYMERGNTLYVEAIDYSGNARLFAVSEADVRPSSRSESRESLQSLTKKALSLLVKHAQSENGQDADQKKDPTETKMFMPVSSYKKVKMDSILKNPASNRALRYDYVREGGGLATAVQKAQREGFVIEESDNDWNLSVKKDGKIIASVDRKGDYAHMDDPDAWEQKIANVINQALETEKTKKNQ